MVMIIVGISGKMGSAIYNYYKDEFEIYGIDKINKTDSTIINDINEIDNIDILIDFSHTSSFQIIKSALIRNIPVICGTTGYNDNEIEELQKYKNFYYSANYAKGIMLLEKLLLLVKEEYELFDFIELHSIHKKDSPSGTAKYLAKKLNYSFDKIQSLRLINSPAIHEVIFTSDSERLIIRHEIIDKIAFIEGIDKVVRRVIK